MMMDNATVYIWLDVIKKDLVSDIASDKMIEAIEKAQCLIREKITGYAE